MTFDPALFNDIARHLPSQGTLDKEARTRSSFGRSYYALFLAIQVTIRRAQGRSIDDAIGHGELSRVLFGSSSTTELKALGKALSQLYEARQRADYTLAPSASWNKKLRAPALAEFHARLSAAQIRGLPGVDFSPILDQLIT